MRWCVASIESSYSLCMNKRLTSDSYSIKSICNSSPNTNDGWLQSYFLVFDIYRNSFLAEKKNEIVFCELSSWERSSYKWNFAQHIDPYLRLWFARTRWSVCCLWKFWEVAKCYFRRKPMVWHSTGTKRSVHCTGTWFNEIFVPHTRDHRNRNRYEEMHCSACCTVQFDIVQDGLDECVCMYWHRLQICSATHTWIAYGSGTIGTSAVVQFDHSRRFIILLRRFKRFSLPRRVFFLSFLLCIARIRFEHCEEEHSISSCTEMEKKKNEMKSKSRIRILVLACIQVSFGSLFFSFGSLCECVCASVRLHCICVPCQRLI